MLNGLLENLFVANVGLDQVPEAGHHRLSFLIELRHPVGGEREENAASHKTITSNVSYEEPVLSALKQIAPLLH